MESLGPYRIVRRLGVGGMGVVLEAWDSALQRLVALKVISPDLADDPGFRARFTREARAQAALDSEHVVQVYAHGEDDGRLWIATQLVPDGDLGILLRQYGAPPTEVALDLIDQVAAGLADAHAAGLVHRDIKPANVLLRRGPQIRAYLTDFGIARPIGAEATATGTVGTPAYLAPELHTGGTPGVATDVYSLGCLLWATLTGSPPYAGGSDFEVATAHRERPVPRLPGGGARTVGLNRVLRTAMAKRPQDRYPSAVAFREALAEVAAQPGEQPPQRRRVLTVVGAAAVVAMAVLAGWALTRSGGEVPPAPPGAGAEQRAAGQLARSLTGTLGPERAGCVARRVVADLGLDALVDAGVVTEDGAFLDPDLADQPRVKRSLRAATRGCVPSGSG